MNIQNFLIRCEERLKELNISKAEFYKSCKISSSAVSQWRSGATFPSQNTINRIAHYLDVDADYLLTGIKKDASPISTTEQQIIDKFRELDKSGQRTIQLLIDNELSRVRQIRVLESNGNVTTRLIPIRRSLQKASAGCGCYLGPEEFETVYIDDTPTSRRASFIVPVQGNSMEPTYHDGDQLLIEKADNIDIGEIGIFSLNGEGFVKKRGEQELLSLNTDYSPIPLDNSCRCNGRVIGILNESNIY